jgi:Tol biopolymer transport system component
MPVTGSGVKGDIMERGFVRIIMAVLFSVLIAVFFTACGDCNGTCEHNNTPGENENGDDDGGGESPPLPDVITRDNVDSNGNEGNSDSTFTSISADGRYVAFSSSASNLVANDTNGEKDIFVHDRLSRETTRVSVDSNGNARTGYSNSPSISADGRYVAFMSKASLVAGKTSSIPDIFVHDRLSGETTRVSVDSNGNEANGGSGYISINADGQYIAYYSYATNLVANDNNGYPDVFVHDRLSGETTRISVDSNGNEANNHNGAPSINADGRYVAFYSDSTNLVANDTNGRGDVFVHDRLSGETTRISVDSYGNEGNNWSYTPSINADGRYVAFQSEASNLVANDTNGCNDVFVHDRLSGEITRISADSNGNEANNSSFTPSISADGRYVAFSSNASNLVANETYGGADIFVHDRMNDTTNRVSVDSNGIDGNGASMFPVISANGRYVTFYSHASNLVPNDTNGRSDIFTAPVP